MATVHLCKCLHCENILIDENPQIGAPIYDLEQYPNALEMHLFYEDVNDTETAYWGCPVCCTDSFLIDEI